MKKRLYSVSVGLIVMVFGLSTAYAELINRGNGLIYDTVQDITWMADANYAATNDYGIANTGGRMTWDNARTWAGLLDYEGYSDWRLFSVDESCGDYNCSSTGNELGHLFYVDLGVTQYNSIRTSTAPEYDFFINVQSGYYWSGVEYAPYTGSAWVFGTNLGHQGYDFKTVEYYGWAVRSGDVAASVPIAPALYLLLLGP